MTNHKNSRYFKNQNLIGVTYPIRVWYITEALILTGLGVYLDMNTTGTYWQFLALG